MTTYGKSSIPSGVSWRALWLVLALVVLGAGAAGASLAYWLLPRYALHLPLQTQRLSMRLPEQLPVEVEILQADIPASDAELSEFPVHVNDTFRTIVRVDTRVPVRLKVPFRGEVPVDITLPINTKVSTRVLGVKLELPISGEIPLQFKLPVDLLIPIDQMLPMKFDLPVSTHINQQVNVRMPTQQAARIRLQDPGLTVTLEGGVITVPLSTLSLTPAGDNGTGSRPQPVTESAHVAE